MLKKIVRRFCEMAALYALCTMVMANAAPTYAAPVMCIYEKTEKNEEASDKKSEASFVCIKRERR